VNIFALLSFLSFILFLQAGIFALWKGHKLFINRVFALLSFLFAIYAGSYTLFFNAQTLEEVYFYDRLAALGWVFFPLVSVWFFIILTKSQSSTFKSILYFFLLPVSLYSYYVSLTDIESVKLFYNFEGNWFYTPYDTTLDYYLFVLYLLVSVVVIYFLLISWSFTSTNNREKYQARVMLFSVSLFFVLSFLSNLVFPFIQTHFLPAMAPVNALVLVTGCIYVLFLLPPTQIATNIAYDLIVSNINEFLFIADTKRRIYSSNKFTLSQLKYNLYEIGKSELSDLFTEEEKIQELFASLENRNVSRQIRVDMITREAENIPVMLYIIKVSDRFGRPQAYVIICQDYRQKLKLRDEVADRVRTEKNLSQLRKELELLVKKRTRELQDANQRLQQEVMERRSAEEQIKADLNEKVKLVQEIHHRVKNNIQMIISLVNMLCSHPRIDDIASAKLREIAEKVRYISRIHEDFYASPNLSNILFSAYLKKAIGDIYSNFGRRRDVVFKLNVADENLDISQAIPLGIIFNELLINSLTYAFNTENGKKTKSIINVEFFKNNGHYSLVVSDNGVGLPAPFNEIKGQKIGLQLISVLAKDHLKGTIVHHGQQGATFIIKFSA